MVMIVCKFVYWFLDEIEVLYEEMENYVVIKYVVFFMFIIMSKLLVCFNVKFFNVVVVEDLIICGDCVFGVVMNWVLVV